MSHYERARNYDQSKDFPPPVRVDDGVAEFGSGADIGLVVKVEGQEVQIRKYIDRRLVWRRANTVRIVSRLSKVGIRFFDNPALLRHEEWAEKEGLQPRD